MSNKMPDKRAMEKMTSDLSRLLQGQNFESEEDLKAYLDDMVKDKKIPDAPPKSAIQFAQDIMYEAWEAESRKERIKLAKEALSISPDCADAYNLLAEEAKTLEEAKELYQKGVDAGRRALGEKVFKEDVGHFWGYLPTRPYMRSLAGLMECLWELGKHDEAISHARKMLKLNTSDNQGIRYILIAYLSELGRYDELEKFMNRSGYKDDCAADWLYTKALLAFVKEGDSESARKELKTALKGNKYVPEYLTDKKAIPKILPDRITMSGEDEGFCYAWRYEKAWKKVPGALDWLKEQSGIRIIPKVSRNDPCPCGSGKKYKKCCGADLTPPSSI
jgi:tetratricopeptide (TPR) repeat protein